MAVKKSDLYSTLWASCDELRGGMDASQYKDYVLTILFVKYVSDKYKDDEYADIVIPEGGSFDDILNLRGKTNIGEGIDKVISKLAEANKLEGIIDNAKFNDEEKIGKGKDMVDKLTSLVEVFNKPELNFKNNPGTAPMRALIAAKSAEYVCVPGATPTAAARPVKSLFPASVVMEIV